MRRLNEIMKVLGIGLTLLTMTSCYQKELCYTHPHTKEINVVFDWKHDLAARPAAMRLYTFSRDDGMDMLYEFADYHGGKCGMAPGAYDALCINSDARRNFFRNIDKRETFEVYTQDITKLEAINESVSKLPRAKGVEKERMVFEPDSAWSDATQSPFVVIGEESGRNVSQTLTLYPKPLFCTYTVEIRNAKNLQHIKGLSATLSSLAGGIMAATGAPTEEQVTVAFDVHKQQNGTSIYGSFRNFGYNCRLSNIKNILMVYALLDDGSRKFVTYDVTDQVRKAPDPRHVHIILDGFSVTPYIGNGSGFRPTVSGWERVDILVSGYAK